MSALQFIAAWLGQAWKSFAMGMQSAQSEQGPLHRTADTETGSDWRSSKASRERRDFPFTDPTMRGHVGNLFSD